jgi:predicted O-methyltransferase YrrM
MSNRSIQLTDSLHEYLLSVSLREAGVLKELRKKTATLEQRNMQISPEQGQFMQLLIRLINARNIIEVGVFTGYSALAMAMALPSDGKLVACDVSEEWTSIGKAYWVKAGVQNKIDLRLAPALETLKDLAHDWKAGHFDLAFIDADKENYSAYFKYCLQLIRPNGLILFDNTLWDGKVADTQYSDSETKAIRDLNQQLLDDERVDLSLLPIGDGLTLVRKKRDEER